MIRRSALVMLPCFVAACAGDPPPQAVAPTSTSAKAPVAQPAPVPVVERAPISTDFPLQYAKTQRFSLGEPKRMTPTEDGKRVLFLRATPQDARNALWEVDVATGQTRELLRPDTLVAGPEVLSAEEKARRERQRIRGGGFTFFEANGDASVIVVSLSGKLYVWKRATGKARELATGPGVIDPHLSPDAKKLAYVRNNDVYVISVEGDAAAKPVAITRGGTETNPHGVADFMAQEEFSRQRGFWWSPDGNEIVYEDADLSKVEKWTLADPGKPEQPPQIVAYPKTGKAHAIVHLAVAQVKAPQQPARKIKWDAERYPYLVSVVWSKNAPLTLYVVDREYRHGSVVAVDGKSGNAKELLTEEDKWWLGEEPSVPRWLPDGSGFLWSSERSGSWELELRGRDGAKVVTVAPKSLGYRSLVGIDAAKKVAYVRASSEPIRDEIWAAPWGGGSPQSVSKNTDSLVYANFGESSRVYAQYEGTQKGEHHFSVRSVDGAVNIPVPSVAEEPPFKTNIEYTKIGKDDYRVAILRPQKFDKARRYPIIDYIYAGPGSYQVHSDARRYIEQQWLADVTDAIVVAIDVRGTARRGHDWERTPHNYGELAVDGHAEAILELAKKYPEMDGTRAGLYGWSGGGYATAFAVLRRPDVFKAGVAGAPVADLRDYDALMERFIGLEPNNDAYDKQSLLTWAARPPSAAAPARPLLLIHGTADDNVYLVHSLRFAEAMARAGRPMEFMPLIGQTHMVSDPEAAAAVAKRTAEFFREHL
ncbi:S9 family peptidase [Pendulispora brunnea]|uniref:S9 family peptidase n=1 Tax=Pendulispora brunnea TaxID=2905690 RepID=A0ABZ2KIK5_9BACT